MSGTIRAGLHVRQASISAVVTRANGLVENLGTIAFYHRNPLRRLLWRIGCFLKGK